jgi:hypothetical protein
VRAMPNKERNEVNFDEIEGLDKKVGTKQKAGINLQLITKSLFEKKLAMARIIKFAPTNT